MAENTADRAPELPDTSELPDPSEVTDPSEPPDTSELPDPSEMTDPSELPDTSEVTDLSGMPHMGDMSETCDMPEVPVARRCGCARCHARQSAREGVSCEPSHFASAATWTLVILSGFCTGSPFLILSTTSMPDTTSPITVY